MLLGARLEGAAEGPTACRRPQVSRFWDKAGRVLAYKRQVAVEAAKREALDRQLDFLVGQTQRYSSLLAKKLTDQPPAEQVCVAAAAATALRPASRGRPSHGARCGRVVSRLSLPTAGRRRLDGLLACWLAPICSLPRNGSYSREPDAVCEGVHL